MTRSVGFLVATATLFLTLTFTGQAQQGQPWMTYGLARISLGMTVEQVEQQLSQVGRHIEFLSDKQTGIVHQNGVPDDFEGQITFSGGRAVYADYHMPVVHSSEELAQEIASAAENMESKTCVVSNYTSRGTGGGISNTIFQCGSQRFAVQTIEVLGSSDRTVSVSLEIGSVTGSSQAH